MTCRATPRDQLDPVVWRHLSNGGLIGADPRCRLKPGHDGRHRFAREVDMPFMGVVDNAAAAISGGGLTAFFQKFTCEDCGARQTMPEPNRMWTEGVCEECGHVTPIAENGCNYMLVSLLGDGATEADLRAMVEGLNEPRRSDA